MCGTIHLQDGPLCSGIGLQQRRVLSNALGHKAGVNKGHIAVSCGTSSGKFATALPCLVMDDLSPPPPKSKVLEPSFMRSV